MTKQAMEALTAEVALADDLAAGLTGEEWAAASDCAGWRVQDVFAHMASVFHQVADPSSVPEGATGDAEATAELMLVSRRKWTPAQVMDEYREWSPKALAALASMQDPPMADMVIPLGNLGHHPLHLLANALTFDHYCHLRHDILCPSGPVDRPALPTDELRIAPTLEWMLGGLPQMCAEGLRGVDRPLNFVFEGPGGGPWVLRPADEPGGFVVIDPGTDAAPAATVTTTGHAFVQWGTKRRAWQACGVRVDGDAEYAASVLDAINVI
jgi:hypothetical protein